mmetsp:Transcript_21009/g.28256  ORF Transcript_21009/g.28256 Transcript_21009/m.28256 type:complete len:223 (-) Transcript_21009:356-1024(-)
MRRLLLYGLLQAVRVQSNNLRLLESLLLALLSLIEKCFLLLLLQPLLKVRAFDLRLLQSGSALLLEMLVVLLISFVDFRLVAMLVVEGFDLFEDSVAVVAPPRVQNKLFDWLPLYNFVDILGLLRPEIRVTHGQFALEDLDELHRVRAFIERLIELPLELSLFAFIFGVEKHIFCSMLEFTVLVAHEQSLFAPVDRFLLIYYWVASHYFVEDSSEFVSAPID